MLVPVWTESGRVKQGYARCQELLDTLDCRLGMLRVRNLEEGRRTV